MYQDPLNFIKQTPKPNQQSEVLHHQQDLRTATLRGQVPTVSLTRRVSITEDCNVYRCDKSYGWRLLGRLPCVLGEPTPIGREVRDWWKALVERDGPCPPLVLQNSRVGGGEIPVAAAILATG